MNVNDMIKLVVGMIVGVLMVSAILIPALSDSTTATKTYTNEGVPYAAYDGEEHTIVVSYDGSAVTITTDGEVCTNPDFSLFAAATIIYGSDGFVRLSPNGAIRAFTDAFNGQNATAGNDVTIVIGPTQTTLTVGTSVKTIDLTPLAYIAPEGEYVLSVSPCVTDDTIILGGNTEESGYYFSLVASGTVNGLTTTSVYSNLPNSATVSNITSVINTTQVDGDLVRIDNIVFTANLSDDTTRTGTYSYFLAPASITYTPSSYVGSDLAMILEIIPMLVTVGIIVGIVGVAFSRRE